MRRFIDSPNHRIWDADLGRWIPNWSVLQFDPEMSTYWREHLRMHGHGPSAILSGGYSLVGELRANTAQAQGFLVRHTPSDETWFECAHVSVYWPPEEIPEGKTIPNKDRRRELRRKLAGEFHWVYGDLPTSGPTGA
jgi:hypothetical protein